MNPTFNFHGFNVSSLKLEEAVEYTFQELGARDRCFYVATLNAYGYVTAQKDQFYRDSLNTADLLIPDGMSISLATRFWNMKEKIYHKVAGLDFFLSFNKLADKKGLSYVFLGSTDEVLEKIKANMARSYENIKVKTYAPSTYPFTEDENQKIIQFLKRESPDVLWVGVEAPKQEKWILENFEELKNIKMVGAIGAAFDIFAGLKHRAPVWMRNNGLEWTYRIFQEPGRLWKKYAINIPLFLYYINENNG